jgi:hypothetical protein
MYCNSDGMTRMAHPKLWGEDDFCESCSIWARELGWVHISEVGDREVAGPGRRLAERPEA